MFAEYILVRIGFCLPTMAAIIGKRIKVSKQISEDSHERSKICVTFLLNLRVYQMNPHIYLEAPNNLLFSE